MVASCDTSFLFSLYGNDARSSKAVTWASQYRQAIYLNSLTHFEFGNALKFSEFRRDIASAPAALFGANFEEAVTRGRLIVATSNLAGIVDETKRLLSIHTMTGGPGDVKIQLEETIIVKPATLLGKFRKGG
jgi:hypothetical protein